MADLQALEGFREAAFVADLEALAERLSGFSQAELDEPFLLEIQGVAKYRAGDIPAAVTLISRALAAPNHVAHLKSLRFLMRAQHSAGDTEGALATAERVIEADGANPEALKLAGRIYSQRQNWDRADRLWRRLCEVTPQEQEAALQVARIAGRREQWETQAFFADALLREAPSHLEGLSLAIGGRIRAGRLDDLTPLMVALYRTEPGRAHAFLRLLGGPEQAELLAEILVSLEMIDPDDEILRQFAGERAQAWLSQAQRYEIVHEEASAAMLFRAARRVGPNQCDAVAGLQRLRREAVVAMREALKAHDDTAAEAQARRVLAIDPAMTEAWLALGRLTLRTDPASAATHLARAAELAPDDPWVRLNLGRAQERAGESAEAIESYEAVVRSIADPADAWRAEAAKSIVNARKSLIRCGRDAYRGGRLDDAWVAHAAAAGHGADPVDTEAMFVVIKRAMFVALREQFKNDDANFIAVAEKYLLLDPDHAETLLLLGRKLMAARRHARAMEVWAKLAVINPGDAHCQLQIARCCSWLKLSKEGTAAAREALRLNPDLAEAATLLEKFTRA